MAILRHGPTAKAALPQIVATSVPTAALVARSKASSARVLFDRAERVVQGANQRAPLRFVVVSSRLRTVAVTSASAALAERSASAVSSSRLSNASSCRPN